MEFTASERLEIALQHGFSEQVAENIVFQALGRNAGVYYTFITQAFRDREHRILGEKDIHKARADAQEPLIEQLKATQEQMRDFVQQNNSHMERMISRIENITQAQITHQPKPPEPDEPVDA